MVSPSHFTTDWRRNLLQAQQFLDRFEFIHSFTKPMRAPPSLRYGGTGLLGAKKYRNVVKRRLQKWNTVAAFAAAA